VWDEVVRVPEDTTDADLLTIMHMFQDYVNASNVTIINVTASHGTTEEWLEQRQAYFGTLHPQAPPPPPEDKNPDVERPFLFNEDGTRAEIPQLARANGLTEHFTETTAYRLRYILAQGLAERYELAGKLRGDPEEMPKAYFARAACGDEDAMLVKVHVRVLLQPHEGFDSRTDFFARMYGVTLDAALKRFDVRTCHTETTENIRLECDPAPSPPPPDDWVSQNITSNLTHAHAHTPICYDAHCLGKHPSSYTERLRTARQARLLVVAQRQLCDSPLTTAGTCCACSNTASRPLGWTGRTSPSRCGDRPATCRLQGRSCPTTSLVQRVMRNAYAVRPSTRSEWTC